MSKIPTAHIGAKSGEIADIVLMPGDPLRAKYLADNFLGNVNCFNKIRNMLGYTGEFKGKRISVMGSGMGMPSMGIYSYELFNFYDVKNIIRVGSAGSINKETDLGDLVLAMGASTNSNYAASFGLPGNFSAIADFNLLNTAFNTAKRLNMKIKVGNVLSSDTFYTDNKDSDITWSKMNVLAVEMEAAALYMNAARAGKGALSILTVSDNILAATGLTSKERETSFNDMIKLALESALLI